MLRLFALGLMALSLTATAKADFVLDDFSTTQLPVSTITTFADGNVVTGITRSTGNVAFVSGTGNIALTDVAGGTTNAFISYDYTTSSSPSFNPGQNFLVLTNATGGAGTLTLTTTASGGITSSVTQALAATSGENLFINLTSLSNIQTTESLALTFTGGAANSSLGFDSLTFTSAPEPASMALAGLAVCGMGGVIARRRRKAAQAAV